MSCGPCTTKNESSATSELTVSHAPRSLKLFYFDGAGRAEATRLALECSGLHYEDIRIPFSEWPSRKAEFTFGQLPVLEVDGEQIPQTAAIFIYACRLAGLVPADPLDHARMSAILDAVQDLTTRIVLPFVYAPPERKAAVAEECIQKFLLPALPLFDRFVGAAQHANGFCVGGKLSGADLVVHTFVRSFCPPGFPMDISREIENNYPHLQKVRNAVDQIPAVQTYLARNRRA